MTTNTITKRKTRSGRKGARGRTLGGTGRAVGRYVEDAASLGMRTFQGLNHLRRLINVETKICNAVASNGTMTISSSISCLSQIAQGSNYTDRVGDSIRLQSLEFRARLFQNTSATQTVARIIIFRDLDGTATAPTKADVLDAFGTSADVCAQYNWLNRDRFSILYDEFQSFSSTGTTTDTMYFRTTHEGHVKYLGTTATAASNGKGSIYVMFISDEATNVPTVTWNSRVSFTDN